MNSIAKKLKAKRPASALVLVVFAIVVMALVGVGLIRLGLDSHVYAIRNSRVIAARSAADAGLAKAIYDLNKQLDDGPWTGSVPSATDESLPNSDATFSYQITAMPGTPPDYSYEIASTGYAGIAQRTVYSTTKIRSLLDYAIFVRNDLILKAGTTVLGFDSSTDPINYDVDVRIGTNSTEEDSVVLMNGVTVEGDVIVGAGSDPPEDIIKGGGDYGEVYASANEIFDPVVLPDDLTPWTEFPNDLNIRGLNDPNIIEANNGEYPNLNIKKETGDYGRLVVESGNNVIMHITGDMTLMQGCEVYIEAGASLSLYLEGDLISKEGSGFFSVDKTATLKIFGMATGSQTQTFTIFAKSNFYGQIYAPNADVEIKAQGDLFGAFVANNFEVKSNGNIYYDLALSFVDIDAQGARFAINRWHE